MLVDIVLFVSVLFGLFIPCWIDREYSQRMMRMFRNLSYLEIGFLIFFISYIVIILILEERKNGR